MKFLKLKKQNRLFFTQKINLIPHLHKLGFTLIELMIVISIIGVLASLAVPAFSKIREKAIVGKCHEGCSLLYRTSEQYLTEVSGSELPATPIDEVITVRLVGKRPPRCPNSGEYKWEGENRVGCTLHGVPAWLPN